MKPGLAYLVSISRRAERDLSEIHENINLEQSEAAFAWYLGLKDALVSLEENPDRCPRAPEGIKLRHLLYGRKPHAYRVIYRVVEKPKQFVVLHIRHGARHAISPAVCE